MQLICTVTTRTHPQSDEVEEEAEGGEAEEEDREGAVRDAVVALALSSSAGVIS